MIRNGKPKILLISPPFYRLMGSHHNGINLGLSYIAAVLKENGHDVRIYNADYVNSDDYLNQRQIFSNYKNYKDAINDMENPIWREVFSTLEKYNPDILGITMFTANYKVAKIIAEHVKEINPKCTVVVGGTHPTIDPFGTLKNNEFDYLIRGEGEHTFLELIEGKNIEEINGLSFRRNTGFFICREV